MAKKIGVGLIGVQPSHSWAAVAHIPALRALSDKFKIAGLANTSLSSGQKAAADTGISARSPMWTSWSGSVTKIWETLFVVPKF